MIMAVSVGMGLREVRCIRLRSIAPSMPSRWLPNTAATVSIPTGPPS